MSALVVKPAQAALLRGPGYVLRLASPARSVRIAAVPPPDAQTASLYAAYGGERAYAAFLNRLATFANADLNTAPGAT